jgi:hypothetical protein
LTAPSSSWTSRTEAGSAEVKVGGVEIVRVDDLAEEAGVEGFMRKGVEQNAGDDRGERGGHGPGGEVAAQIAGGERGQGTPCHPTSMIQTKRDADISGDSAVTAGAKGTLRPQFSLSSQWVVLVTP